MEEMMKKIILVLAIGLMVQFAGSQAMAQNSSAEKAANCSTYARNRADSEASATPGALGGAARGAAGGAIFGAIVGGHNSAGRGAALGAGLGAVGGAARKSQDREARYRYYYDACMRGEM